ncbi:MAG TPA: glycosyltransferase family 9 protein [Pyrinomonadaceae bacterium]|nr:glycosyltransferase family 9 protein [Pyrinomonadaceae bacterium]
MNSLRDIVETSPKLRALRMQSLRGEASPQPLGPARWDWQAVKRILIVRLRSIGDTVLATPSLCALKRFVPHARVDILLEDWVAPVLNGFPHVDHVITLERKSASSRARVARQLRANCYDVVYNLHGGTTATLLTRATGAKHRIGYRTYQYARLHNELSPASSVLWGREKTHSVEQQLALLGWTGVPVSDRPPTQLAVTAEAAATITTRLKAAGFQRGSLDRPFAVIHPAAAFATKQWAAERFGRLAEHLISQGLPAIAIITPNEKSIIDDMNRDAATPVPAFTDLSLPEITALLARARLFIGNDSGIAHIAAAVAAPSVVIFGSSNTAHWRPWASAASEIVFEELECQPCHGYFCEKFAEPECIKRVPVERVVAAAERVLRESVPNIS